MKSPALEDFAMKQRFRAVLCISLLLAGLGATAASAAPRFPSLQEQFRESKVIPGSALAQLIRANQDFSILRPEEAKDQLLIPAWLRVIWRKAHPEGVYAASDPTGGYPLVLREVHEWMRSHQDLKPGPGLEPADAEEAEELAARRHPSPSSSASRAPRAARAASPTSASTRGTRRRSSAPRTTSAARACRRSSSPPTAARPGDRRR